MAAKFGVPVCPHAGGVGLCELVQHLSIFDYVCVSGSLEGRMIEYVDHLHEHFVDPVVIRDGALPGADAARLQRRDARRVARPLPLPGRRRRGGVAAAAAHEARSASVDPRPARSAIDEYERLHADAWPGVLDADPTRSNIRNYTIFRDGDDLFAYSSTSATTSRPTWPRWPPTRDPALVEAHRRDAGAAPGSRAGDLVEDDPARSSTRTEASASAPSRDGPSFPSRSAARRS